MPDRWHRVRRRWRRHSTTTRLVGVYGAAAVAWIALFGLVARALELDPAGARASIWAVAGFALVTGLLLFFLLPHDDARRTAAADRQWMPAGEHGLRADEPGVTRAEAVRSVESITDDFFALDRDWHFTYVNRNAERFFGHTRRDLLGRRFWDVFPTAVDTPFSRAYHRAMEERVPVTFEAASTLSPGKWLGVRVYPSDDGIVVYARDVTERKRAEDELRRQKVRFENLFECAPEAIAIVDQDDRILRANAEFGRMFGYAHADLIGRTIQELIVPPDQYEASLEITRRTAREGQRVRAEAVRMCSDGTPIDVSILTVPFREEASDETLAYGIYRDITARRDAEQALRDCEEKFRVLVEASLDAIFIETVDGRILDCNDAACRMFDHPRERLVGLAHADLMPAGAAETLPDVVADVTGDEPVENTGVRSDGTTFPTEVATKFVRVGGEKRLIAYVRDISARKQLEAQLRRARKMEAVDRLAGDETVLVVEDEDSVRRVVCRALGRYGYAVLEAADGQAALATVREHAAAIDLILSDLIMPRMSGQELHTRLEQDGLDIPIIFMTGYSPDTVDHRARVDGTHEVLSKPIDPDRLVRVIREVLDARRTT